MKGIILAFNTVFMLFSLVENAYTQNVVFYEGKNFTGASFSIPNERLRLGQELLTEGFGLNNNISSIKIIPSGYNVYVQLYDEPNSSAHSKAIMYSCNDLSQIDMDNKISMVKSVGIQINRCNSFFKENDPTTIQSFNDFEGGFRLYGTLDNKLNYFGVSSGYAAILWENADDEHDKLHKGFGQVFVVYGQGGLNYKQAVGPKIRNKVSYVKIVPENKLLENL